jgi:hypothetical protein
MRFLLTGILLLVLPAWTWSAAPAPKNPKMSSAVAQIATSGIRELQPGRELAAHKAMNLSTEGLQVYLEMVSVSETMLVQLRSLGVIIELADPAERLVQARVLPAQLDAVAALASVRYIRLPDYAIYNQQGTVDAMGDAIVRANMLRRQTGVSGAGVRVGVISDGLSGLSQSIASADLPATTFTRNSAGVLIATSGGVTAQSFRADQNLEAGAEGTAMLEIIHHIAPGAQLFFANASTSLEFNQAVNALAAQTDIGADDIGLINVGPYDGTSFVSQNTANALNSATNPIRAYFTAAGNLRLQHYRGAYNNSGTSFPSIDAIEKGASNAHLFTATADTSGPAPQPFNEITVPPGGAQISLQWDDPFGASANDYDLFVLNPDGSIVTASHDVQNGTQNPTESVFIPNPGSTPLTLRYVIVNYQNLAAPRTFEVFLSSPESIEVDHQFNTPGGSVPNQADAGGGVLTVGAVPSFLPDLDEFFSGEGPTLDGRLKPDLAAPDVVNVSGAGGFGTVFAGTSAAAPHAAAVAALLLSQNPDLTRSQLADLLKGTATDLGPLGPDNRFGFGRIDALPAAPHASVASDSLQYHTGDTLHLSTSLRPGAALNVGDAYLFVILPDGSTYVSLIPGAGGGLNDVLGLQPLALGFSVPPFSGEFFQYNFLGTEPSGLYQFEAVLTLPGQTPVDPSQDIIFDAVSFLFSP